MARPQQLHYSNKIRVYVPFDAEAQILPEGK